MITSARPIDLALSAFPRSPRTASTTGGTGKNSCRRPAEVIDVVHPLVDHETIVQLIGSVRTTKGLFVKAKLDTRTYETGISVRDSQIEDLNIICEGFHGDWNYTVRPNKTPTK